MPRLATPKPRKRRGGKIILLLLLFFIVLLAVLFFRSDVSKIDSISIAGNRYTDVEEIGQALAIAKGDSFFAATAAKLEDRISKLPYVKQVLVKKSFPGEVSVQFEEFTEVAYFLGTDGRMNALLENGAEVEPIPGEAIRYLPILSGWEEQPKQLKKLAELLANIPGPLLADISQIKPDPTNSYPDRIRMYTRSYFEVITTIAYLPNKLDYMRAIIGEYEPGIITMLEANTHQPYSSEGTSGSDSEEQDSGETGDEEVGAKGEQDAAAIG